MLPVQDNCSLPMDSVFFEKLNPSANMGLRYNSPVILTFTLICTAVLMIQQYLGIDIMKYFMVLPEFNPRSALSYLSLFTHVIGHGTPTEAGGWDGWGHLVGNFSFILLLGPILEEKYGSQKLLLMMIVTALVTGILQIFLFNTALLGASGIVFMFILLSSFTNTDRGIPLTFVLVVILFLGKEIQQSFADDQISQFAHIIGGFWGQALDFFFKGVTRRKSRNLIPDYDVNTLSISEPHSLSPKAN